MSDDLIARLEAWDITDDDKAAIAAELTRLRARIKAADKLAEVARLLEERDEYRDAFSRDNADLAVALLSLTDADAEVARLREALAWYGEQARLCRLIHSEGDAGRQALNDDGGTRARAALTTPEKDATT